jgi:F-type H+-transporting ATPase subunit epsilon
MNDFVLHLQSATQYDRVDYVVSFVSEDSSGSFGLLAHHERMITCLKYGLAWFRFDDNKIDYLALPGGVLYFVDNQLYLSTRHYVRSTDYQTITKALDDELRREEENLREIKESLHRIDEEILKRLWELKRRELS